MRQQLSGDSGRLATLQHPSRNVPVQGKWNVPATSHTSPHPQTLDGRAAGASLRGEPFTRSTFHLPNRYNADNHERGIPRASQSPRNHGEIARARAHQPSWEDPHPIARPPTIRTPASPPCVHYAARTSDHSANYRYLVDFTFGDLPVSVWVESSRTLSHISYYPDSPDPCLRIHFTN